MSLLAKDMEEMRAADIIDLEHYCRKTNISFVSKLDALRHFISLGQERDLNPHPMFHTQWYKWQNPGYRKQPSVLHHYIYGAQDHINDPSPMVDMPHFVQKSGLNNPVTAINAASDSRWGACDGVYRSYKDLVERQKMLRSIIKLDVLRSLPAPGSGKRRKNLLWVQHGPNSQFVDWFDPSISRNWDLLVNWYTDDCIDASIGDGAIHQVGTKFTAVAEVWRSRPDIFDDYQHVLFFDDDQVLEHRQVDKLFDAAEQYNLDVFQAALTEKSHGIWPVFRQKHGSSGFRRTNGVEIMMPGFSVRALWQILPLFNYAVSGFGLDFLIAKLAREMNLNCGVIDAIPVHHSKEINQVTGAYYNFLRKFGLNSKAELWYLVEAHELECEFYEAST